MYGITVYSKVFGQRIDWQKIVAALTSAGYVIERDGDSNQIFVDGYYGPAVRIINALGYVTDEDAPDPLTTAEAAAALGLTPAAVRKAVQYGTLRGEKRAGAWFFSIEEIERYRTEHLGQQGKRKA